MQEGQLSLFFLGFKTKEFESVAIARYAFGDNIPSIWNKDEQPNQWEALKDYIVSKNPKKLGSIHQVMNLWQMV